MTSAGSRTASAGVRPAANLILAQYGKTFGRTQFTIGLIALAVLLRTHRLSTAMVFLTIMQLGAAVGAVWATRLKTKVERSGSDV
jgi:hypothetical protein